MHFSNSLKRSLEIVNRIKLPDSISVECYSNGREQGLCLLNYKLKVCICEDRRSDNIVVYFGKNDNEDFDPFTNMITEKTYRLKESFSNEDDAIKFITKYFS